MKVKFAANWFAPSEPVVDEVRSVSGQMFKKGVQEVPDRLRDVLPSSAIVLDGPIEPEPERIETLLDYDIERAGADELERVEKAARRASKKT